MVHLHPYPILMGFNMADITANCIHPAKILKIWQHSGRIEWNRIILSAFIHVDDVHLYYNMLSLSWKGSNLEKSMGPVKFSQLVVFSLFISHVLMFLSSYTLYVVAGLDQLSSGFNTCAVGFSAVLFSLKYVWNSSCTDYSCIMGINIPTRFAAWLELVLISVVSPNASFLGHFCGIVAGMLYLNGIVGIVMLLPHWIRNTCQKLFSDRHTDDTIDLEYIDDLHLDNNSQFVDTDEIRQLRLRRFGSKCH